MQIPVKQRGPARLRCIGCGGPLQCSETQCSCPGCGATWPVEGGIVRFSNPEYWGELPQDEARRLVQDCRAGSWRAAVEQRFPSGDMNISILDPQRAAWLPLLGLRPDAVVLDIGSGLGAITHALAGVAGEVYSLEAIAERIEFTQVRLQQEGLDNVHLVQSTARALPFFEETFDLVVVNGILEWVGEWDLEGTPGSAQLRFLSQVRRLLKKTGIAVIGIENRFGYVSFLGDIDHSGLPYTSLMPRRMATTWLRRQARQHHRTRLNPKQEYRTYTYSARGYRKLIGQAGFGSATYYWADPGYNQPYNLVPVNAPPLVRGHLREMLHRPGARPARWFKPLLKDLAVRLPLFARLVPDFVILAPREEPAGGELLPWLRSALPAAGPGAGVTREREPVVFAGRTAAFSSKQVLRFWQPAWARDRALIKVEPAPEPAGAPPLEYANLQAVQGLWPGVPSAPVRTPQPLGMLRLGAKTYCLESLAQGTQLSRPVCTPGYFLRLDQVESDFTRVFRAGVEMAHGLRGLAAAHPIAPGGYTVPATSTELTAERAWIESARYFTSPAAAAAGGWVQHGDFTIENVFLDATASGVEVIDWATLGAGFPPLYDLFSMVVSSGFVEEQRSRSEFDSENEYWAASFSDLFLSDRSPVARLFGRLLLQACDQLQLNAERIPSLLIEFLIVRINAYRARGSHTAAEVHTLLLETLIAGRHRPVLGRFPLSGGQSEAAGSRGQ